jgi:hypothetical protein
MRNLLDNLYELVLFIIEKVVEYSKICFEWFLELGWPEKLIFLNGFAAVYAVTANAVLIPVFKGYYVKNPVSVYLVVIAMFMFATHFYCNRLLSVVRVGINLWYLIYVIYQLVAEKITKAETFEICGEYYINFAVPVVYILSAVVSQLYYRDN